MRKSVEDRLSEPSDTPVGGVGKSVRKDGRRPLLVYLDPSLIRDLKKEALDRDINVYELVEESLRKRGRPT